MRDSLIALLQSPDKDNRMAALEMNKGLHIIDDILADFEVYKNICQWKDTISYIITNGMSIDMSGKGRTKVPKLPEGLKTFNCSYNNIKNLPPLPNGLEELYCSINKLTELPELPNTLEVLTCRENLLTHLPKLPTNLKQLICSQNNIRIIHNLPLNLTKLWASDNNISKQNKDDILQIYPNAKV